MAYTTEANVQLLTNLTTNDISSADMGNLITQATYQLNADINTRVIRERVRHIDNTRKNTIDSSNTTFYVKNWRGKYLGDMNNSGTVTVDDITVYQVAADGTETELAVSTITHDEGKFVLNSAPASGVRLYVTYEWSFEDEATPSKRVEQACTLLTAAFCYEKINRGMSPQQVYGNVRFMRDMRAGNEYYARYLNLVDKINAKVPTFREAKVF